MSKMSLENLTTETGFLQMDLYDVNRQEAIRRLPVVLFIGVLALAGIIGNLHVLYVYTVCFKPSTYRVVVLSLAIIDMMCCCVSMPFEMVDELFPFAYYDIITCKIFRFINTCVAVASAFMLVLIASERFRRICRPYASQMSVTGAIHSAIGVLVAAVVFTSPALYVYGRMTIPNLPVPGIDVTVYNVTGYECTWGDHMDESLLGYFYYAWVLLSIIGSMIALVVLYTVIGVTLRKHNNAMRLTVRNKNRDPILSKSIETDDSADNRVSVETRNIKTPKSCYVEGSKESLVPSEDVVITEVTHGSTGNELSVPERETGNRISERKSSTESSKSTQNNRISQEPLRPRKIAINDKEQRITKILFTIAVLFICSFLPYIIILIAYVINSHYSNNLNTTELVLFLMGLRFYMVNSVANSVLYGFFDHKFRKHVKRLYKVVFDRCKVILPGKDR